MPKPTTIEEPATASTDALAAQLKQLTLAFHEYTTDTISGAPLSGFVPSLTPTLTKALSATFLTAGLRATYSGWFVLWAMAARSSQMNEDNTSAA